MTEIELYRGTDDCATPDFNRLARIYRWMEWLTFGPFLQRCRLSFLSSLGQRRQALILGDGDGRFVTRLIQANANVRVDAIDTSEAMLRQLAKSADSARVHAHIADARTFQPPRSDYDLVATHFFLDCLNNAEVANLAFDVRHHVTSDALWVISDFAIPSNFFGRVIARPLVSGLYLAFGLLTNLRTRHLPDHRPALEASGWCLTRQKQYLGGLLISEFWELNRS